MAWCEAHLGGAACFWPDILVPRPSPRDLHPMAEFMISILRLEEVTALAEIALEDTVLWAFPLHTCVVDRVYLVDLPLPAPPHLNPTPPTGKVLLDWIS